MLTWSPAFCALVALRLHVAPQLNFRIVSVFSVVRLLEWLSHSCATSSPVAQVWSCDRFSKFVLPHDLFSQIHPVLLNERLQVGVGERHRILRRYALGGNIRWACLRDDGAFGLFMAVAHFVDGFVPDSEVRKGGAFPAQADQR